MKMLKMNFLMEKAEERLSEAMDAKDEALEFAREYYDMDEKTWNSIISHSDREYSLDVAKFHELLEEQLKRKGTLQDKDWDSQRSEESDDEDEELYYKKVLVCDGPDPDCYVFATNAPMKELLRLAEQTAQEQYDGEICELTDLVGKKWYSKVLYDSVEDDEELLKVIGWDTVIDLSTYFQTIRKDG